MSVADFAHFSLRPAARTAAPATAPAPPAAPAAATDAAKPAAPGENLFDDLIDVVNPLQHLPVVSTLYRHLTGDKIGTPEKLAGDYLYGGPMGLAFSLGDTVFEKITGKTVGDTVYAMVLGDDQSKTAVAAAAPAAPAQQMAAAPVQPVAVTPAESTQLSLPSLPFSFDDEESSFTLPSADIAQRAMKAYQSAGNFLPF